MIAFYDADNVETYILTIMNMVSSLYKDPALGNHVQVVVVNIVLIEIDEAHPNLNITNDATRSLESFCK